MKKKCDIIHKILLLPFDRTLSCFPTYSLSCDEAQESDNPFGGFPKGQSKSFRISVDF